MSPVFTGTKGPVEQPRRIAWTRSNGFTVTRSFRGAKEALEGLIPSLISSSGAESFELVENGPDATLTANYGSAQDGADEQPQSLWELVGNDIEKDLRQLPGVQSNVSKDEMAAIEAAITNDSKDYEFDFKTSQGIALFELRRRGTTSFTLSQYVLRHSLTFSSAFDYATDVSPALVGVGKIWPTGTLLSYHGGYGGIPATLSGLVSDIPAQGAPNHVWGWLKRTPTVAEISGGRFQYSQEWWLELWSTFIYPVQV